MPDHWTCHGPQRGARALRAAGHEPAPYIVADLSTKWMFANVIESDIPKFHLGQAVRVKVTAYPDRVFEGKVTTIGTTVDTSTHRQIAALNSWILSTACWPACMRIS